MVIKTSKELLYKMKFKDKEFEIFGTKYTISHIDKIESEDEGKFTSGQTNPAAKWIRIAKLDYDGKPVESDSYKVTLLHELIHAILDEGQYQNSSSDEPLVEWLARCLKSLIDQKII